MGEKIVVLNEEITLTDEATSYNEIRCKYQKFALKSKQLMGDCYDKKITSCEIFQSRQVIDEIFHVYKAFLTEGVLDLISYGIYDVDEIELEKKCVEKLGLNSVHEYQKIADVLGEIDKQQGRKDQQRKDLISDAGHTIRTTAYYTSGDTFSNLGYMVKNEAENMVVNAGIAAATSLITSGIRKLERNEAEKKKNSIYSMSSVKTNIIDGLEKDVFNIHFIVVDLINELRTTVYTRIEDKEKEKIEPILRNILHHNFTKGVENDDLERKMILEYFIKDSYEPRLYVYMLEKLDGDIDALRDLINYFGIHMEIIADSYIRSKYGNDVCNSYEEAVRFKEKVHEELKIFDIESCDFYHEVLALEEQLFIVRRTFHNRVIESIELRDQMESEYNAIYEDKMLAEFDIDDVIRVYFETYNRSMFEYNRIDIRQELLDRLNLLLKDVKDVAVVEEYITQVTEMKVYYGIEEIELIKALEKKGKSLGLKIRVKGAAGSVVLKGKDITNQFVDRSKNFSSTVKAETGKKMTQLKNIGSEKSDAYIEAEEKRICPQCGASAEKDDIFCLSCGMKLQQST